MKKESWKWGIATCLILGIVSLILAGQYPCNSSFPGGICISGLFLSIINFFGLLVLQLFQGGSATVEQVKIAGYLAIIISLPIYFLVGIILRFFYHKLQNSK